MNDDKFSIKDLATPANLLSLARIPLAIIMIIFYQNQILFIVLLTIAIITDLLDGYVARLTKPTVFGAFLDPLCDKIFFTLILIFIVFVSGIPLWQLFLLLLRDIFMALMAASFLFHSKREMLRQKIKARWFGKMTTATQFTAVLWLATGIAGFEYVVYAVALLSVAAIIDYSVMVKRWLAEK
ncbi:CDP-alcohol phosphatidyltransferase family protein [Candidatus Woesearchaeota archaeon]|nr:CDP-alcohol phosphatidyltransferase family protein [Candidatus Woesearchaeota archaeon]